ncbi:inositol-tetrakisphosphate 1-kinase 3-like isoform X2 [Nymphaea colorata]|uniref:inositol-tetrakisphosphate 1-kinase 3-like isoform X2 n=1 Tax=Nymphaea colorata TaxID=210225 RepID=UPI00129D967F|nr:inositol-tetrakisphosphate 1-kinase 3-like isoform X2 [Nymphaea colorata]
MKNDSIAESPKVACRDNAESRETEEKGGGLCFLCGSAGSSLPPKQKLVVGYALKPNKIKSFLQPRLEALAREKGIMFVAIDQNKSLLDQGPFDIVLHKFKGKEWFQTLQEYVQKHPEITVIDPPGAIEYLDNRQSMLNVVDDLNLSYSNGKIAIPKQLVVRGDPNSVPDAVKRAGLKLPLVVKPLVLDGTAKSHELFLAYDHISLSKLEPPLVLQEFVNHDVENYEQSHNVGLVPLPRVSFTAASAVGADLDPHVADLPPFPLIEKLAGELRQRLGLLLFNIDIIREHGSGDNFYVIDINYFPGYEKIPDYEHIFTDFLLSLVEGKSKEHHVGKN